jgi:hypothetical protein
MQSACLISSRRPEKMTIYLQYSALTDDLQLKPCLYCSFIYRSDCQATSPYSIGTSSMQDMFNQHATSPGHSPDKSSDLLDLHLHFPDYLTNAEEAIWTSGDFAA